MRNFLNMLIIRMYIYVRVCITESPCRIPETQHYKSVILQHKIKIKLKNKIKENYFSLKK